MKLNPNTENDLMERFRRGDERAFKVLFDHFWDELCYFSYRLTHNREQGEEIVSEAMRRLFERHQNFETVANIKSFLYIVTRNLSYHFLESVHHRHMQKSESIEKLGESGDDYLSAQILKIDLLKKIWEEVESLPEQQKTIFKLFYFHELTITEIANKLDLAPTTVRTHKFIAVEKLKVLFSKAGLVCMAILIFLLSLD